jgi:hypothetical protein
VVGAISSANGVAEIILKKCRQEVNQYTPEHLADMAVMNPTRACSQWRSERLQRVEYMGKRSTRSCVPAAATRRMETDAAYWPSACSLARGTPGIYHSVTWHLKLCAASAWALPAGRNAIEVGNG